MQLHAQSEGGPHSSTGFLLTLHMWAGGHCITVTAITQLELSSVTRADGALPGLGFGRGGGGAGFCGPGGTMAPVDHRGSGT